MKKTIAIIMCLIMVLTFAACGEKQNEETEFGWGTLENGTYTNSFFNFSIDISPSYSHLSPQEIINKTSQINDPDSTVEPLDITLIEDLSLEPYVQYIYASKYAEDVLEGINPSIKIYSENMKNIGTLYSKEAYVENYLAFTKLVFANSDIKVDVFPIEKPWIDERQFAQGTMKINYADYILNQSMYAIIQGNYVLVILLEYTTPAEEAELKSFMDTIKLK